MAKRPWNQTDHPVYSLSTIDIEGVANMNICTYVSAVTLKPKKFMVAVDIKSQTHVNITKSMIGVLQLLSEKDIDLVRRLGKKTGKEKNKLKTLKDRTTIWKEFTVLTSAYSYLYIEFSKRLEVGDHDLFVGEVIFSKLINTEQSYLHLESLRAAKIIRG